MGMLHQLKLIKKEIERKKDFGKIKDRILQDCCWFYQQGRCIDPDQDHLDSTQKFKAVTHICYFCAKTLKKGKRHEGKNCPLLEILDDEDHSLSYNVNMSREREYDLTDD